MEVTLLDLITKAGILEQYLECLKSYTLEIVSIQLFIGYFCV